MEAENNTYLPGVHPNPRKKPSAEVSSALEDVRATAEESAWEKKAAEAKAGLAELKKVTDEEIDDALESLEEKTTN